MIRETLLLQANEDDAMENGNKDERMGGVSSSTFVLDGKRFVGFDAHEYLRDECGFTDREAVQYLSSLALEDFMNTPKR